MSNREIISNGQDKLLNLIFFDGFGGEFLVVACNVQVEVTIKLNKLLIMS